jgi:hypothetical protein
MASNYREAIINIWLLNYRDTKIMTPNKSRLRLLKHNLYGEKEY